MQATNNLNIKEGCCTRCGISRYKIVRNYNWGESVIMKDMDEPEPNITIQSSDENITD